MKINGMIVKIDEHADIIYVQLYEEVKRVEISLSKAEIMKLDIGKKVSLELVNNTYKLRGGLKNAI